MSTECAMACVEIIPGTSTNLVGGGFKKAFHFFEKSLFKQGVRVPGTREKKRC
jgi:hypothetical protein